MSSAVWDALRHLNECDISDKEPTGGSAFIDGHQTGYPKAIQRMLTSCQQRANELNSFCQYLLQGNYIYGEVKLSALSYV